MAQHYIVHGIDIVSGKALHVLLLALCSPLVYTFQTQALVMLSLTPALRK